METQKILLVEDNPDDEAITLRALKKGRIINPIDVVRDGASALEYFFGKEGEEPPTGPLPALVLLDLKLPKVDGHQVLQQIRSYQRTRYLPVVVLTSSDAESDYIKSFEGGANSYIVKPVGMIQIAEAVQSLGLYWSLLSDPRGGK
ncbi:response regulator [bacterium]|nr:response regulator [bacterium]